jgi:transposase
MTRGEFDALAISGPDAVFAVVARLDAQVAALEVEVQQLRDQLAGNSRNSHRPPSSDRTPPPRPQRVGGGKPRGGQPGHPGETLRMVGAPDRVLCHHPAACAACGAALVGAMPLDEQRRQVFEVPPPRLEVTEHRAARVRCPRCQHATRAAFPPEVTQPTQYGPRVEAIGVYLRTQQLLPYARTCAVLADLLGCRLTAGTLEAALAAGAARLAPIEAQIAAALARAPIVHADETGLSIGGQRHWLHVASTATLTHYATHRQRGAGATDAIGVLPRVSGRLIHDGWAAYRRYPCARGLCNAHHLRELTGVEEREGQPWATALKALLREAKAHVAARRAAGATAICPAVATSFTARYRDCLAAGLAAHPPPAPVAERRGRPARGKTGSLLDRLARYEADVLAFLHDWRVPFDNNQAERDLRMMKVQQKISGTFRSDAGATAFCRLRGYLSTLQKQGRHLLTALEQTFADQPPLPALSG